MGFALEQFLSKDDIRDFCKRYHVTKLAVFGSAVRNELRPDSDIDILVEFDRAHIPGLFTIARMETELARCIGRTVDLRTPEDLSRYFRDDVVRTAEVQYAE
ncbi:MAG: nucleotidyltransferase [Chitinivibrionales bacterium]|nr:nucleotidyltransferase [Chitinivibrionales bacterium]